MGTTGPTSPDASTAAMNSIGRQGTEAAGGWASDTGLAKEDLPGPRLRNFNVSIPCSKGFHNWIRPVKPEERRPGRLPQERVRR